MIRIRTLLPVAAAVFAAPAFAQQQAGHASTELLQAGRRRSRDENASVRRQRRAEYDGKARRREKDALAAARRADSATRLDATSKRLSDTYAANELRISNLNTQLRDKAAALGLGRAVRLGAPGRERHFVDPAAVADHDAVPAGCRRAAARRVVAAVLRPRERRRRPRSSSACGSRSSAR